MIYLPGQLPGVIASAEVITGARSQLSVAVAVPVLAGRLDAVILMVTGAGQVMTGGRDIAHGDRLGATRSIAAVIRGRPGSENDVITGATARGGRICIGNHRRRVAVVRCVGGSGICGQG